MTRANNPPTIPALAPPTGQPIRPQNGHTEALAYIPEKTSHQVKNFNKPAIIRILIKSLHPRGNFWRCGVFMN
jgi:hypothetical protein